MDTVADLGFHLHQLFTMTCNGSQVKIHTGLSRTTVGPAVEQDMDDASVLGPLDSDEEVGEEEDKNQPLDATDEVNDVNDEYDGGGQFTSSLL